MVDLPESDFWANLGEWLNLGASAFSLLNQFLQTGAQGAALEVFFYLSFIILYLNLYIKQVLTGKSIIDALTAINGVRQGITF